MNKQCASSQIYLGRRKVEAARSTSMEGIHEIERGRSYQTMCPKRHSGYFWAFQPNRENPMKALAKQWWRYQNIIGRARLKKNTRVQLLEPSFTLFNDLAQGQADHRSLLFQLSSIPGPNPMCTKQHDSYISLFTRRQLILSRPQHRQHDDPGVFCGFCGSGFRKLWTGLDYLKFRVFFSTCFLYRFFSFQFSPFFCAHLFIIVFLSFHFFLHF